MDGINKYNEFVALHKPQLESSAVPVHLWPALYRKLSTDCFDAGEAMQLLLIDYDNDDEEMETDPDDDSSARPVFALEVAREQGIKASDPQAIYLIDHAWTFRLNSARQQLEQYPQLADRLSAITGVDLEHEQRIDKILRRLWKYCHAYSLSSDGLSDEERMPIWYVMDEVGSAVNHSDTPSFRLVPLLHLSTQTTYSLLFPIRDCEQGSAVTRDFVEYVSKDAPQRSALLLPWSETDLSTESFLQVEPSADYFASGHIPETYPTADQPTVEETPVRCDPLKVYAEYDVVCAHLTAPEFVLVDNKEEADVLWLTTHYKNFAELAVETPHKYINQFPFEYVITIKDLLSIVGRRAAPEHHNAATLETYPAWLPTTYNLSTELRQFVAYYQQRAAKGLDNHWIIKPWNLARGLDTHITDNIKQIVRLPATGPKIAQKYIERPVLFHRDELKAQVKFDVRYVILLKSVKPLQAYVHRKFFLRFANRPYSLDHFDDYEKHYTVMNYQEQAQLHHIKCDDFLELWQQQYPKHNWSAVEQQICSMLYEVLQCASKAAPPCGLAPCAQSRALYAADIMLDWTGEEQQKSMQPKLLEINWTPDCKRACDYYPEFFNDIFKLLFLDEQNSESFRLLTADGQ
ncbi:tubulin--tyrosine ligase-like protein 12 [Drosophila albomicans]|uniref:Tubulin--tyrosine ligase-like protein 12 n=1 Tax=Drosophila albomicans TaxID=7291 RepID=A0A6P8XHT4_DROAB|nr:tubulin--tyrosine ligase-like protein 12 [Drosophila albomicans]